MRKIQVVSLLPLAIASTLAAAFPKFSKDDFSNPSGESAFGIVRSIELDDFAVASVRYLPDGQRVIVGSSDGRVALVDLASARAQWAVSPIANFRDWISVLDVDPTGQKFVFIVSGDQGDAYMTLYIASTQDGRILKKISGEKSNLYQKHFDYEIDLRYPGPDGEKKRLEEDNLAAYWLMVPYAARFTSKGGLITSWKNSADTHAMYDRSFRLFDSNFRKVWEYQVKADEKTWDPLEPAGFKNGLPVPPIVEMTDGSFLFGTPHARVQQITDALAKSNMKKPNLVDQAFAPVFANPKSIHSEFEDTAMPVSDLAVGADGKVYVSAGDGGQRQIYAFDGKTRREIFHSHEFDASHVQISPNGKLLATGYLTGAGSRVHIIDLERGKLLYMGPRFGSMNTGSVVWNPKFEQAAVASGSILLLSRREKQTVRVGTSWTRTGIFARPGVSICGFGNGAVEITTDPKEGGYSFSESDDFFAGPDGRIAIPAEKAGELYLKAESPGNWTIYGGLKSEEFSRGVKPVLWD
ncbi:MAG TPA: hypothetical protein PKN93_07565 [Leptospiraceae bacterium]|nr:hypothetical protein [Leptospiraceae bacterium]